MPTSRSYQDPCGIARALDVVGERWALLVVRELLLGGRRFSDLRRALPRASSNMLADRLRELESHGVVHRPRPPLYELTPWGRDLEPVLLSLGSWALREVPVPDGPLHLSAVSILLFLRGSLRSPVPLTLRVDLDETPWTVRTSGAGTEVEQGAPETADAALATTPLILNDLAAAGFGAALDAALADGRVTATGDLPALRGLRVA
ncbi:winged helix-turn-helix transcriptional regulator [Catenuloplanes atrovinosus]|uniref:DNA-binding HxlR family transcriptional regulator n=1 Tax=Catenuloplanes atrovinosus TaxID=137266 RepID=A0AAE3YLE6_9ACTN|nr:helix-turn-helix domain-containing protein [Catenuloplanes atrovinosus]MDR7274441.1 DNA-binding HxlR family transcriptional regulator [Catenuloplanes atrovinosus]